MALTGIDPNDPTPRDARELIFGAGEGSTGESRDVLIYGNRTSAGSEAVDALGSPIADDQDAQNYHDRGHCVAAVLHRSVSKKTGHHFLQLLDSITV